MRSYLTAVPPRVRTGIRRPWRCWSPSVAVSVAAVVYALLPQSLLCARFAIPIIELAQEVRVGPNICRLPLGLPDQLQRFQSDRHDAAYQQAETDHVGDPHLHRPQQQRTAGCAWYDEPGDQQAKLATMTSAADWRSSQDENDDAVVEVSAGSSYSRR
jgi:hypothetical protein